MTQRAEVLQKQPRFFTKMIVKLIMLVMIVMSIWWGISVYNGGGILNNYIDDKNTIVVETVNVSIDKAYYLFGDDEITFSGRNLSGFINPVTGAFKVKVKTANGFKGFVSGKTTMSTTWEKKYGNYNFNGHGISGNISVNEDPSLGRMVLSVRYKIKGG